MVDGGAASTDASALIALSPASLPEDDAAL